ncbi:MAG: type III pantothenate kinase [Wenzhouxiangellaceae bacterium]|nr:type III pantothenate kinase [Wenzhouxiangellaceae bacterium]
MCADWLLELGHSRLKLAGRNPGGRPGPVTVLGRDEFAHWLKSIERSADACFWLAAVPGADVVEPITTSLEAAGWRWQRIVLGHPIMPVAPAYAGLGVDRWLALQPAWAELKTAFCVVDCGTATTVDLVDGAGIHRGGWIFPGRDAARAGLISRAPGLQRPCIDPVPATEAASDTALAIERGLVLQQAGGIGMALDAARSVLAKGQDGCLSSRAEKLASILTGGAGPSLQSLLEIDRIEPDLVLRGLSMAADLVEAQ